MTNRQPDAEYDSGHNLPQVVQHLRQLCAEQGWDQGQLARRAGVSRTTLHHLLHGQTGRPRSSTLGRLAAALGTSVAELERSPHRQPGRNSPVPSSGGTLGRGRRHILSRSVRHCVISLCEERPGLFSGWTEQHWDQLYRQAGSLPQPTAAEVGRIAGRISQHRETLNRLRVVLDSHLESVAEGLVETLYRQLTSPEAAAPAE